MEKNSNHLRLVVDNTRNEIEPYKGNATPLREADTPLLNDNPDNIREADLDSEEHEIPLVEKPELRLGRMVSRATRWNRG